jgi:hypothetical protein
MNSGTPVREKYGGNGRLTIASETIRLSETAPYISFSVSEAGFDGLARANLRFSEQGGP